MRVELSGAIKAGEYGFLVRNEDSGWSVTSATGEVIAAVEDKAPYTVLRRDNYRLLGLDDGTARVIRFADLHRHSDNSLQDGLTKVKDMVAKTEYAGALTDHGNMYGFLEFYKGMKEAGKHPIIGFEGYMESKEGMLDRRHVILLAKDNTGYKNLLKLTSESFDHFKQKPHVTWDMLEKYHEGILCMSACLGGAVPSALRAGDKKFAHELVERFISIFGREDFYIEIQNHHLEQEDIVRPQLVALADEYDLKIVATTDSHYPTPEDREAHDILLCMQTEKTINDPNRMRYDGDGYFLHNSEQMEELFSDYPEALDNSLEIAEKCNVEIRLGDVNLPNYDFPPPFTDADGYMVYIAKKGFHNRFNGTPMEHDKTYIERFDYEISMIKQMGFCAYFIIVWDFINYAKSHDIYVGPGRGSAAGSMVAYCMGITDLDPIKYNLLFERFLNPERISYPDIDTDIEHRGRPQVIQYMVQKYGAENVCRIVTFGTFASKQVLKDVARVLEQPASYGALLANMIPSGVEMTLDKAMETSIDLQKAYKEDAMAKRIFDIAKRIEGGKRHSSVHACGLCVAPSAVSDFLPTSMEIDEETGEKVLTAQVTMSEVEELSLIKMDLLGLKNMSVIHEVCDAVVKHVGEKEVLRQVHSTNAHFRFQDIPLNDRKTYEMLRDGQTGGVFQLESPGMTKVIRQMLEDVDNIPDDQLESVCFERLIAAVALYRPGPMDYIPEYIEGMRNPASVHYDCPEEEVVLSSTYGVLVYQEQLMQIAQRLAGYTLGEADILRKACGKKKKALMAQEQTKFIGGNREAYESGAAKHLILGCTGNGVVESIAAAIWEKVVKFASYAFNRSHAACYAYIGYVTAYMSCHWPAEFYAAMLNAFIEASDKTKSYLAQADKRGIKLMLPDIQKSECLFTGENGSILFGLQGISGLKSMAVKIVDERNANGSYGGLQNLYERMAARDAKLQKKSIEGLVYSGALNVFSENKAALLEQYSRIDVSYKADAENRQMNQISLFGEKDTTIPLPKTKAFSEEYAISKEMEMLGMYVSYHPTDLFSDRMEQHPEVKPLDAVVQMTPPTKNLKTLALIKNVKRFYTKQGKEMASFEAETKYASLPCVIFPDNMETNKPFLKDNEVYCLEGNLGRDLRNEALQMLVREIIIPEHVLTPVKPAIKVTVHNKEEQTKVINFVKRHPGEVPVVLVAGGKEYPLKQRVSDDWDAFAFFNNFGNN